MNSANLNITVIERRMLPAADAAKYCGLPGKYFKVDCPVRPIEIRAGVFVYDKRDLDEWLDSLKAGAEVESKEDILRRLR